MKPIITRAFQSFLICVLCSASLSCDRSKDNNSSTQQRIDSSEKILEALRPISPREPKGPAGPKLESASAYINLSLRYYNEGRWEECIDACIEALDLDPNSAVAYNNICSAYN
ncbi:MAG: tetratricopeptide repeat protein, partial [Gammaproteobacteria bacterium]|nr:tetratricopeptide repeat protein [Gammaproteobacteria bacterium]